MAEHYAVALIPTVHKNAINAVIALIEGEDPRTSERFFKRARNHLVDVRSCDEAELAVLQDVAKNISDGVSWPVAGVDGDVTAQDAAAACAALRLAVVALPSGLDARQAWTMIRAAAVRAGMAID